MRYLPLLLLLFCNTAMACNSYEDCMAIAEKNIVDASRLGGVKGNDKFMEQMFLLKASDSIQLRAIAFKLDEISGKIAYQNELKEREYRAKGLRIVSDDAVTINPNRWWGKREE